jgi:asparagine N-glycosylation enzyme membrane subunit Stt3
MILFEIGVMIRLLLVLAPASCVLAGIGGSEVLEKCGKFIREHFTSNSKLKALVGSYY